MRFFIWIAIAVACTGCKNDSSHAAPTASASVAASANATNVIASASASASSQSLGVYAGSYTASAGVLYVPDAAPWDGVKFRGDHGDAGALGDGKLTLTIDPKTGSLSGDLDGPLGPATLSGVSQEKSVSFHLAPKAPGDLAFTGTGTGVIDGDKITGEIHASSWRANVLRDATFELKK